MPTKEKDFYVFVAIERDKEIASGAKHNARTAPQPDVI